MAIPIQTALDNLALAQESVTALRGALAVAEKELARAQAQAEAAKLKDALAEQAARHKEEIARLKAAHREELRRVKAEAKTARAKPKRKASEAARKSETETETMEVPPAAPTVIPDPVSVPAPIEAPSDPVTAPAPQTVAFTASVGDSADRCYLFPSEVAHVMACLGGRTEGVIPCLSDTAVSLLSMLDDAVRGEGYFLPDEFSVQLSAGKSVNFSLVRAGLSFRLVEVA